MSYFVRFSLPGSKIHYVVAPEPGQIGRYCETFSQSLAASSVPEMSRSRTVSARTIRPLGSNTTTFDHAGLFPAQMAIPPEIGLPSLTVRHPRSDADIPVKSAALWPEQADIAAQTAAMPTTPTNLDIPPTVVVPLPATFRAKYPSSRLSEISGQCGQAAAVAFARFGGVHACSRPGNASESVATAIETGNTSSNAGEPDPTATDAPIAPTNRTNRTISSTNMDISSHFVPGLIRAIRSLKIHYVVEA
jgi:hypothetical protein